MTDNLLSARDIQALCPQHRKEYGTALLNLGTKILATIKKDNYFLNGSSSIWQPTAIRQVFEQEGMPDGMPINAIRYYVEVEMHRTSKPIDPSRKCLKGLCKKIYRRTKGNDFNFYDDYTW